MAYLTGDVKARLADFPPIATPRDIDPWGVSPCLDANTPARSKAQQRSARSGASTRSSKTATAERVALGTSRIILHPEQKRRLARGNRYRLRDGLRGFTGLKRLRACGHTAVDSAGVMVRVSGEGENRRAGFAGLSTCGSVWACPVCAAKVAAERARELTQVLNWGTEEGLRAALVTLTVRHHAGDSLASVWDAVSSGWARVTGGKAWKTAQERYGIKGWARAVEVTHGGNGWHVHVHAVVLGDAFDDESGIALGHSMWRRWAAGVRSVGLESWRDRGGLDVRVSTGGDLGALGAYLAKQGADLEGLAAEATLGAFKEGRKGSRTPFQIARSVLETGDAADVALWREWEQVSKGRRQLTWSRGLRVQAGLANERTDEEIAAEEVGTSEDDAVLLPGETWKAVRESAWLVLDIAEERGVEELKTWLGWQELAWLEPPKGTPQKRPKK